MNSARQIYTLKQPDINRVLYQDIGINTIEHSNKKGTWVLLRGLLREKRHWDDFPQQVQTRLQADRVICLDVAGNGLKSDQTSPNSIAGMVEELRSDLKKQAIPAPVNIIALSMGAMIATDWVCRYPKDIEQLVLINTSMQPFSRFFHRLRPGTYPRLVTTMLSQQKERREELILQLTSNQQRIASDHAKLLKQWLGYQREYPVSASNVWRQLNAAKQFTGPSILNTHPILLLASKKDRLVNYQCSQAIAHRWDCPLAIHPEAGHDLSLDDPDWVINSISAAFIKQRGSGTTGIARNF